MSEKTQAEKVWGINPLKEKKPEHVILHWFPPTQDARGMWSQHMGYRYHRECNEWCEKYFTKRERGQM